MNFVLDEMIEKFKVSLWNEVAFWIECRPMFELIYLNKERFIKEFPQKKEMIEELCESKSEQDFLKVLRKYQTEEDRQNIWVEDDDDGSLYLM